MLEWKNQILKRRRHSAVESITQQVKLGDQTLILSCVSKMLNYFLKLVSLLVQVRKSSTLTQFQGIESQITHVVDFQLPEDLLIRQQAKVIQLIYRRIKTVFFRFEEVHTLSQELTSLFLSSKNSPEVSSSSFFSACCDMVIKQIRTIKKARLRLSQPQKDLPTVSPIKQRILYKLSNVLTQSIYNILEIDKVQACSYFLQGVSLMDNVKIAYDKVKHRNKKTRLYINEYSQKIRYKNQKGKLCENQMKQVTTISQNHCKERLQIFSQIKQNLNSSSKQFRISKSKSQKSKENRSHSRKGWLGRLKPAVTKQKQRLKL